jgi:hypothetical protein
MRTDCQRDMEIMTVVSTGRWPDGCSDELRNHIASCSSCSDVLEVARALHEDRELAGQEARIPSPDLVWWRAELRARQEAVRVASRPITLVQAFGAAATVGVAAAFLKAAWPWIKNVLAVPNLSLLSPLQLTLVIAFALGVLVIAPLAMYVVLSDE